MSLYSPSIDQGAKLAFEQQFFHLAEQNKSYLQQTKALLFLPSDGKTNNMARMGGNIELSEVATRNPDKVRTDYGLDNRQMRKRRFTTTVTIDQKHDVNELLKDPSSDIMMKLDAARMRVMDRIGASAAVGNVLVGAPDEAPTSITAAQDGVITVDATGGVTYEKVQEITQNFINANLFEEAKQGTVLCITGKENTSLMSEIEFISNDYIDSRPVNEGTMKSPGIYSTILFAGSVSGGETVANPILPEGSTERKCLALAPNSIAMSMELGYMGIERNPNKVNSLDLTVDFWVNAMRTEGSRVQIFTTTI